MGKKERDVKRRAFLESSRDAIRRAKAEEEAKLAAQWSKSELRVDYSFSDEDFESAVNISSFCIIYCCVNSHCLRIGDENDGRINEIR